MLFGAEMLNSRGRILPAEGRKIEAPPVLWRVRPGLRVRLGLRRAPGPRPGARLGLRPSPRPGPRPGAGLRGGQLFRGR